MIRHRFGVLAIAVLATTTGKAPLAQTAKPGVFIQTNISAAKIAQSDHRYLVDISLLASDFEEMFQKSGGERVGVDLSQPGALEREIGRFVQSRVAVREDKGTACEGRVERAGEDPTNDEAVLVVLSFNCAGHDVTYDATKLLSTQGPRAWQVVTIIRGEKSLQVMVNGESPPVAVSGAQ